MYLVYAIKSKTRNYIYVGLTNNIERRLKEHNEGFNKTTKPYRPFELIYWENYNTRIEAREREKYLKTGYGKEFLKKLIWCRSGGISQRLTRRWSFLLLLLFFFWVSKIIAEVAELVDALDSKSSEA